MKYIQQTIVLAIVLANVLSCFGMTDPVASLNKIGLTRSPFIPVRGLPVVVYSIKADGTLESEHNLDTLGGEVVDALLLGDTKKLLKRVTPKGTFPVDAVFMRYNPLGTRIESLLQFAVQLKNEALINALLKAGADINYGSNSVIGTALHTAVAHLNEPMVSFLLTQGAQVNSVDASKATPLHVAAALAGSPVAAHIAETLIKAGADASLKNKSGVSPSEMLEQ